ncbi:MAG: acyl-CoA thioesterase [Chthonomonas sp.]|nr:acyl-CoA thioesterase [Chthonomonas sp.]
MISETTLRVRYAETDQMGHAYYANYLVWLEVARTDWCRQAGFTYASMEAEGFFLPVVNVTIDYKREIMYDEEVTIRAWAGEVKRVSFSFHYEIWSGDVLRATGSTTHVVMGRERKAVTIPDKYRAMLSPAG